MGGSKELGDERVERRKSVGPSSWLKLSVNSFQVVENLNSRRDFAAAEPNNDWRPSPKELDDVFLNMGRSHSTRNASSAGQ